jgi:hypothetical protein
MDARLKVGASQGPVVPASHPGLLRRGIPAFEGVSRTVSQPGRPLEPDLQAEYGWRFGRDFGGVRVHTDPSAAASATAIGATAYTLGRSIVFAAGRYAPGTSAGRRLLAHELAHVDQQDARDGRGGGSFPIDPSASAEAGAREHARAAGAARGAGARTRPPRSLGEGIIQRQTTDEENKPKTESKPPAPPPSATAAPPASTAPPQAAAPPASTAPPASAPATQPTSPRRVIDVSKALGDWHYTPLQPPSPSTSASGGSQVTLFPPLLPDARDRGVSGPPTQPAPQWWRDLKQPEKENWLTKRPTPPLFRNPDLPAPMEPGSPKGQLIVPGPALKFDSQFKFDDPFKHLLQ